MSFVVCGSVGLDTSSSTVPYVAGWGEDGQLDAIRGFAETIDALAKRIEDALVPTASAEPQGRASLAA